MTRISMPSRGLESSDLHLTTRLGLRRHLINPEKILEKSGKSGKKLLKFAFIKKLRTY
jgi:hypothetical protein